MSDSPDPNIPTAELIWTLTLSDGLFVELWGSPGPTEEDFVIEFIRSPLSTAEVREVLDELGECISQLKEMFDSNPTNTQNVPLISDEDDYH